MKSFEGFCIVIIFNVSFDYSILWYNILFWYGIEDLMCVFDSIIFGIYMNESGVYKKISFKFGNVYLGMNFFCMV